MPISSPFILTRKDGQTYPIGAQGLTLGNDPTNDIVIEDSQVATRHARILYTADRCFIRDERGSGGTYVNRERVEGQRELFPGDNIQVGSKVFKLAAAKPSTLPVPPVAPSTPLLSSKSKSFQSRRNFVLIVLAFLAALSLLLVTVLAKFPSGLSFPTATETVTRPSTSLPKILAMPTIATKAPPTATEIPIPTATPIYAAKITCVFPEPQVKSYSCMVTYLGNVTDTLWLLFTPYQLEDLNGFEIAVTIKDQEFPITPNIDTGLVEIGNIEPSMEKEIEIRLVCSQPSIGCLEIVVYVRMFANNGLQLISGQDGEFVITHVHEKPKPIPMITVTNTTKPRQKSPKPPDEGPGD